MRASNSWRAPGKRTRSRCMREQTQKVLPVPLRPSTVDIPVASTISRSRSVRRSGGVQPSQTSGTCGRDLEDAQRRVALRVQQHVIGHGARALHGARAGVRHARIRRLDLAHVGRHAVVVADALDEAARASSRLLLLDPRALELARGLVRGPVLLLARPAAVHDALARVAHADGAMRAARARAAALLASPGGIRARARGCGARRRAALSRGGRKRNGLRRDRHGREADG